MHSTYNKYLINPYRNYLPNKISQKSILNNRINIKKSKYENSKNENRFNDNLNKSNKYEFVPFIENKTFPLISLNKEKLNYPNYHKK